MLWCIVLFCFVSIRLIISFRLGHCAQNYQCHPRTLTGCLIKLVGARHDMVVIRVPRPRRIAAAAGESRSRNMVRNPTKQAPMASSTTKCDSLSKRSGVAESIQQRRMAICNVSISKSHEARRICHLPGIKTQHKELILVCISLSQT